jgi:hypothetical protein
VWGGQGSYKDCRATDNDDDDDDTSRHLYKLTISPTDNDEVPASHHSMAIVLGVLTVAAVLILGGIFTTATLVICRRRSAMSQLQQDESDAVKLRQEQRPNVYSEPPAPLNPATVFSVPSHVPRGCCTDSVPRVRFRTDCSEMQDMRCVYVGDSDDSPAVGKRRNQSTNGKSKLLRMKNKPVRLVSLLTSWWTSVWFSGIRSLVYFLE